MRNSRFPTPFWRSESEFTQPIKSFWRSDLPVIKGLLVAVGLKDTLLEAGVTRMDPISPPTEESPFMDLLAWQVYHLISKLGSIDPGSFVFG